jgi:hypothetical protein
MDDRSLPVPSIIIQQLHRNRIGFMTNYFPKFIQLPIHEITEEEDKTPLLFSQ